MFKFIGSSYLLPHIQKYNPTCNNGGTQAHEEEVWVSCKK
jgi:hypothetical protein